MKMKAASSTAHKSASKTTTIDGTKSNNVVHTKYLQIKCTQSYNEIEEF